MRKRIITPVEKQNVDCEFQWLDIENIAIVEITSEDAQFPIESALLPAQERGWQASTAGEQTVKIVFDTPQDIHMIRLIFTEFELERTQEYALSYSLDNDKSYQEIVRQQWTFSPNGSTTQSEEHQVDLQGVNILKLIINPDLNNNNAFASMKTLRLR